MIHDHRPPPTAYYYCDIAECDCGWELPGHMSTTGEVVDEIIVVCNTCGSEYTFERDVE